MPRSPAVMTMSASFHDEGIFLSMRAIWRQAQSHSCQAPSQMSGSNPCERSATSAERDLVGGKRCRRDDAGALLVFFQRRLGRTGQIERFDAWPIETTAVDRRACAAGGQESPFGCQIAMEDLVRPDAGDLHPRAPFSRSRMKARTASTWPSATSSAAVRWP